MDGSCLVLDARVVEGNVQFLHPATNSVEAAGTARNTNLPIVSAPFCLHPSASLENLRLEELFIKLLDVQGMLINNSQRGHIP